jgi:hypothetical protein
MNFILRLPKLFLFLLSVALFVSSCKNDTNTDPLAEKKVANFDNKVVVGWNDLFLEVERYAQGYRPGPAPRALSLLGLSAYEACVPGMPDFNSLQNEMPGLTIPSASSGLEYHWPTVVNASYGFLMAKLFPEVKPEIFIKIDQLKVKNENNFSATVNKVVFDRSRAHGEAVASAIWEWSKTDTYGHDAYKDPFKGYDWKVAYKKEGDWKPLDEVNGKAMFPYWGKVRSYTLKSDADKLCSKPYTTYSTATTSNYYAQALEVMSHNTPQQPYESKWIGEFWSDDLTELTFSPPSRWIAIANQVYQNENSNLETVIFANAKVGLAINDAGVGCWFSKYVYNVERPFTYIRNHIKPDWITNLSNPLTTTNNTNITPSFPAFPSGHATFGGAAAEALSSIYGYNYSMTDNCHKNRSEFFGTPRTFNSFYEMAEENGFSRIPLGVHWRMDSEEGVKFGKKIGNKVNNLPWKK